MQAYISMHFPQLTATRQADMLNKLVLLLLQGIPWDRMQFSREHYRVGSSIQCTAHKTICTLSLQSILICWYLL